MEIEGYMLINKEGAKVRFCTDCIHTQLTSDEIDLSVSRGVLTILDASMPDDTFGKICHECHAPLGNWLECKYCHCLINPEQESHGCDEMRESDEYEDFMDGVLEDDGWVTRWKSDPLPD